eukprot:3644269-Pleurochrysis_carterae.AAC.6
MRSRLLNACHSSRSLFDFTSDPSHECTRALAREAEHAFGARAVLDRGLLLPSELESGVERGAVE